MKLLLTYLIFSTLFGAIYSSHTYARVGPPSEKASPRFITKTGKELCVWVDRKYNRPALEGGKLIYQEFKVRSVKSKRKFILLDKIHINQNMELDVQLSYIKRIIENKSGDLIIIVDRISRQEIATKGTATYVVTKDQLDTLP